MTKPAKRLLFVGYTPDFAQTEQTIKHVCALAEIEMDSRQITSIAQLDELFQSEISGYDYLFLGAHGCVDGFAADSVGNNSVRWADFSLQICQSKVLKSDSVLYLGCCKGGMKSVAQVMMFNCNQINFVAGPACNVFGLEIGLAFHTFIIGNLQRNSAKHLSDRVTSAIGQEFNAFDRSDMHADLHTLRIASFCKALDEMFIATEDGAQDLLLTNVDEKIESNGASTH